MALSEATKAEMARATREMTMMGLMPRMQKMGPVKLMDDAAMDRWAKSPDGQATVDDIKANRKEAETYLAGLLGMT